MPLTLHVDAARWREHVRAYVASHAGVVPVVKGNGYGFGNAVLAGEAARLGVQTLAVGTYDEVAEVERAFPGDLLVLSPWRPGLPAARLDDDRVVHTVSRLADLRTLAASRDRPRVVVEVLTSMRRHGIEVAEIDAAVDLLESVRFAGWALHLPLAGDHEPEARSFLPRLVRTAGSPGDRLWVSHLPPPAAARLAADSGTEVRLRVGTALWLGDRAALAPRATVLDVHRLSRGDTYGYRQRRARADGWLLVLAGGTTHGVALEAPTAAATVRQRVVALGHGGLSAAGRALSPYRVGGRQRWFAEPPHMQCSLVWLPGSVEPPAVGDEVPLEVRYTTTAFDRISWD
ncbi:MAG TPA: alanine racemase [Jiangellales bacterium]|nr:alanine racemase [Jiangellales bacterium]